MPSQQFLEPNVLPEQKSSVVSMVVKCEKIVGVGEVIDCCRFSSLGTLLRVTGYVLRFIFNLISKIKGQSDFRKGEINVEEIDESKMLWVKYEQYFIQKDSKYEKIKNSLNLYFDENSLIHSKTKFSELAEMSYERKHPLLLRNSSYFTKLIVLDSHEKVFHNGVNVTLNFIRATYWIIKGRQIVKSVLRKYVTFKLVDGKLLFLQRNHPYQVLELTIHIHSKPLELIMPDQCFTKLLMVEMLK